MYQPSTEIRIGTVPWNPNYKHVRWYPNLNAQMTGIASFMDARRTISTYTYQRLESAIDVAGNPEQYYNYNYVMFQNENFGTKWFYAFITRAEYKTANTTRLHLELDYVQTYMFDYDLKPCFVEREHVNDDSIGAHVKDEGIDPGELKCVYSAIDNEDMDCYMVVASAVEPLKDGTYVNNGGDQYMGVTSGTSLSVFLTVDQFKSFMQALSDNGQQDAVSQVYMCPRAAIPNIVAKSNGWGYWVDASSPTPSDEKNYNLGFTTLDGYSPKNNKMYCFPFEYAEVTNFTGASQQLRLEFFGTPGVVSLQRTGGCDANSRLAYIPTNYNGVNRFVEGAVYLDKYPTCNWVYQAFANMLGASEVNTPWGSFNSLSQSPYVNSFIDSTQNIIGSALNMDIPGMLNSAINGAQDLTNTFANFSKASKTPNTQRGGTNSTTALVNFGTYTIGVRKYTCRAEIARQIDDFLSVYGYNVSVVKTPNITGRASWNYVKTVAANMSGSVPAGYLAMFNRLLDSGVTFWHTDDVGNYSLSNAII
jgi:hypothetical protein